MNYPQSQLILEKVKKAKRILVNCHRNPDADSIGSALGLCGVLRELDKEVRVICPTDTSAVSNLSFLQNFEKIEIIDFSTFDFSKYDLFITLDSSSMDMVSDDRDVTKPEIPVVVVDHHKTDTMYGDINLVDDSVTSTGELLFLIFEDWNIDFSKEVATALLAGIIGDTGVFRFHGTGPETIRNAGILMEKGADKDKIVLNVYHCVSLQMIEFWAEVLKNLKLDGEGNFVWSAIAYERFRELGALKNGRETAASDFASIVEGTDFGIIMVEQEPRKLSMSLRSRTGFDTSQVAVALGGGGHVYASGAKVEGLPFNEAVEKVLRVARKFAKEK